MADLTSQQRQHLKKLAHHLKPVVQLGKDGLSEPARNQIEEALNRHELVKLRLSEAAPLTRQQATAELPGAVGAFVVQNIGRVFVLYRPNPEKPRIELPWPVEPEQDRTEAPDLASARAPRARATGSLLRSVRERGRPRLGGAPPVPPVRDSAAPGKTEAKATATARPRRSEPKGTPKGGHRAAPRRKVGGKKKPSKKMGGRRGGKRPR